MNIPFKTVKDWILVAPYESPERRPLGPHRMDTRRPGDAPERRLPIRLPRLERQRNRPPKRPRRLPPRNPRKPRPHTSLRASACSRVETLANQIKEMGRTGVPPVAEGVPPDALEKLQAEITTLQNEVTILKDQSEESVKSAVKNSKPNAPPTSNSLWPTPSPPTKSPKPTSKPGAKN